jgi:hypothetical protein
VVKKGGASTSMQRMEHERSLPFGGLLACVRVGSAQVTAALRTGMARWDRDHKIGLRRELSAALNVVSSKNARVSSA